MHKLDRCPFCGAVPSDAQMNWNAQRWQVWCSNGVCAARGPLRLLKHEAEESWNRRTLGRTELEK